MGCICCEKGKLNLGCVTTCESIEVSYIAPSDDTYKLTVDFGEEVVEIESDIIAGNPIVFDISPLNESYWFTGRVSNSSGDLTFIDAGLNEYDCITFQTKIGKTGNAASVPVTV